MNSIREKNFRDISGFDAIPEGWTETSIDEICNIGRGRVISVEEIKSNSGDYPVFSSQTRDNGKMGSIGIYDFDGDYVTWTTDGENAGTVFFRSGKFNCTNVCGTLSAKNTKEIDLQFLSYHLGRIAKKYVSYIGNPKLMNGVMASVGLALPDFTSQKKIAKILTTIDQLIEKTQALIDKHTAIKQGMMADLFTRGIDPTTGQLRPPVEQAPHLYKETELGWVPKEWDIGKLDGFLNNIEQGWSPDCESQPAQSGNWGVLKTTAVVWGGFNCSKNKALPDKLKPRLEYEINVGDVLMTRAGPGNRVGVVAYVGSAQDKLMLSDKLYRILSSRRILNEYLAQLLSSDATQRQLNATKTGLAESQSNISQNIVKNLMVAVPTNNEQKIIVKRANSAAKIIKVQQVYLNRLKVIKVGLMQDLLTGKVKVTDCNIKDAD